MAYTQGFHPHQRINLGVALPLGFTSDCELIDLWMEKDRETDDLKAAIAKALPPGLILRSIVKVGLGLPSLQKVIKFADYRVSPGEKYSFNHAKQAVENLLGRKEIHQERRGKEYDLRPLIDEITVAKLEDEVELVMRLSASQVGTGRPDEVLRALGFEPEQAQIVRTGLVLTEE
jgi:radical SAM-linked protein